MVEFDVKNSRNLEIYYNVSEKILGRIPTRSNLVDNSDNSLYFGILGADTNMEQKISSILGIPMTNFGKQKYSMIWDEKNVNVETNLNAQGQLQFKINVDGFKSGVRKMILDYMDKNDIDDMKNIEDYAIFMDFSRMKISFHKIMHIDKNKITIVVSDQASAMKDVEKAIKEIDENYSTVDYNQRNAYVDSLMHVRSTAFQRVYRGRLLKLFECKCAICNINIKELLFASHIVPYYECKTNEERVDPNNGLLLCSLHDDLFDKGFISFGSDGKIIFSKEIQDSVGKIDFIVSKGTALNKKHLTQERIEYLKRHKLRK